MKNKNIFLKYITAILAGTILYMTRSADGNITVMRFMLSVSYAIYMLYLLVRIMIPLKHS